MKHHIRTLGCGIGLLAAMVMVACGGRQTMASKSAAAFDEARKKGISIASGEHGGHTTEAVAEPSAGATGATGHSAMAGMDHSRMSGMDHSATPATDPSAMPGMQHGSSTAGAHEMAGMDHTTMPGMQHGSSTAGAHDRAAMDHAAMPQMAHGSMPAMRHRSPTATPMAMTPPTSNAAIAHTQPAATLQADEFDAPAPTAVAEAAKGATGMSHAMDAAPKPPAPPQHDQHPPSGQRDGGNGEAS